MKNFTFIILLLANFSLFAQKTYVPDDNFEQALINLGYDSGDLDDSVPTDSISKVTTLDVNAKHISDLTGIEGFTALKILYCGDNQLTSLDVTTNTNLTVLYCSYNQLTSLNATTNTNLTELYCADNQLTSLDVAANTDLEILYCFSNQLTSLDVAANNALTRLYCSSNQLTSLDVTANTVLRRLNCAINKLTNLDVSTNTVLQYLDCSLNQLTSLDVSVNTDLIYLDFYKNQLTSLDVPTNTKLTTLNCSSNQLTSLDVRNGNNANLTYFTATDNPDLTCIYVDDNSVSYSNWSKDATATYVNDESECSTLTYVPDDNFEQALIDKGFDSGDLDDYVPTANISEVTLLSVVSKSISDLTGIEDFAALTFLDCFGNQLTSLDVSANTALTWLSCEHNQLTSLDVSANTYLNNLYCEGNQLTSLDVTANTGLRYFYCYSNKLTSLDVRNGNSAKLAYFYATDNPDLTCIYVDDNTESYSGWEKDETATYVNDEAECTALASSGLKNVSEEKTATAIDELEDASEFSLFPNPVKEQFTIQTNKKVESLKLYNLTGKLVKAFDVRDTYSVSGLPAGIYYLSVSCKEETFTEKLVIE